MADVILAVLIAWAALGAFVALPFLAFGLGFSLLVGLTWGYAQWAMETTPWALASAVLIGALAAALYGVSLVGQRLGASQMVQLRAALEELLTEHPSPPETEEG